METLQAQIEWLHGRVDDLTQRVDDLTRRIRSLEAQALRRAALRARNPDVWDEPPEDPYERED